MTIDVRKYFNESGYAPSASDPFAGDQVKHNTYGPSPEYPFRYTQDSQNRQGSSIAGQQLQNPTGRSAWGGVYNPMGVMNDIHWDGVLPMRSATIASGDVSQYENLPGYDSIVNPDSLLGREQIAQLPGYEGETDTTNVFDMNALGEYFGFTPEQVNAMLGVQTQDVYRQQTPNERGDGYTFTGPYYTEDELNTFLQNQPTGDGATQLTMDDFALDTTVTSDLTSFYDPENDNDLSDEEAIFMGLAQLSDSGDLDFDMNQLTHLALIRELGAKTIQSGAETSSGFGTTDSSVYDTSIGDSLEDQQKRINDALDDADDSSEWKDMLGNTMLAITLASIAAGWGAAFAPAVAGGAGPVVTGAIQGGITGGMGSGLSQLASGEDIDWTDVGTAATVGGALGGLGGSFADTSNLKSPGDLGSSIVSGAGSEIGGLSGAGGLSPLNVAGAGLSIGGSGAIQGYLATQDQQQALEDANKELELDNAEQENEINNERARIQSLFGTGDNPYYYKSPDIASAQEGFV